jgi:septum formation protein
LRRVGLDFATIPADVDETIVEGESPAVHADRLARLKASVVARRHPDAVVIGSDTIVVLGAEILGKPASPADAERMLGKLSGREHQVLTGVAVAAGEKVFSAIERVRVRFRDLSPDECREYAATGEPLDKAGAYGIQGYGSALVDWIEGDYFAVMGLPIVRTLSLIEEFGWRYAFGDGLVPLKQITTIDRTSLTGR